MLDFLDTIDLPDSDDVNTDEIDDIHLESCVFESTTINEMAAFHDDAIDIPSTGLSSDIFSDPINAHQSIHTSIENSSFDDETSTTMDELSSIQSKLDSEDINEGYTDNYVPNNISDAHSSSVTDDGYNVSFGMHVEDREWNINKAKWYEDIEKRESHEAELDVQRGDISAARDHIHAAESARKMKEEYIQAAKNCKK